MKEHQEALTPDVSELEAASLAVHMFIIACQEYNIQAPMVTFLHHFASYSEYCEDSLPSYFVCVVVH